MPQLILKKLTCHATFVPLGMDEIYLRYWMDGNKSALRTVNVGHMGPDETYDFAEKSKVEFQSSIHFEFWSDRALVHTFDVSAAREWEVTAEIAKDDGRYSLVYVVAEGKNNGEHIVAKGEHHDNATKVKPDECNVCDPIEPCPLGNLTVRVHTRSGAPVVGAAVVVRHADTQAVAATGKTDSYGMVKVGRVNSDTYHVSATKPQHASEYDYSTVTVNAAETRTVDVLLDPAYLYFAIYYTMKPGEDNDAAYQRAAETWKREVMSRSEYHGSIDDVLLLGFLTEDEFNVAWNTVNRHALCTHRKVIEGHIFSHGTPDGVEASTGTVTASEIAALPVLEWEHAAGQMVLHGCRNGVGGENSPAAAFAKRQLMKTSGFTGYGYFSDYKDRYYESSRSSKDMYLDDYDKLFSKNCWFMFCSNRINSKYVYHP